MHQVVAVFAPIFVIALLGYIAGRTNFLGETAAPLLSRFVFFIAMPPLFFSSLMKCSADEVGNRAYLTAYALAVVCTGAIYVAVSRRVFGDRGARLYLGLFTTANGNAGYLGLPLCLYAFGDMLPAIMASIIHMIFIYPGLLALIELDLARQRGEAPQSNLRRVLMPFAVGLKNPLVLGTVLGLAGALLGLRLPEWAERTCTLLGQGAIPLAVFALGLTLAEKNPEPGADDPAEIGFSVVLTLVVMPLFAWLFGALIFHLDHRMLGALVFVAALPSPKNSFILAHRYGLGIHRAAMTVFGSTLLSALSLPVILYLFREAL